MTRGCGVRGRYPLIDGFRVAPAISEGELATAPKSVHTSRFTRTIRTISVVLRDLAHLRVLAFGVLRLGNLSDMRTIPALPNMLLRDSIWTVCQSQDDALVRADAINALLASTVAVTHDGSVKPRDGKLPKGRPLSFGVARDERGGFMLTVFSDRQALQEPDAPTSGRDQPIVALAGDDLVVLAARNGLGLVVNPGSEVQLFLPDVEVREYAHRVERVRSEAGVRLFDTRTLITMRSLTPNIDDVTRQLIAMELHGRGLNLAYVVEYAEHDMYGEPGEFKQLVVVGGEEGEADHNLLADARTVVTYATGRPTDAVAYASMPQAHEVTRPLFELAGARPETVSGAMV